MHIRVRTGVKADAVYCTALLQQALDGNLGKLLTKGQSHEIFPLSISHSLHLITDKEEIFLSEIFFTF